MEVFTTLSPMIQNILRELENQDRNERQNHLARSLRLHQIPRETGEFLFQFLLCFAPQFATNFTGIEIGTSGGYSTIWLSLALKTLGYGKLISIDNDPNKYSIASSNIERAKLKNYVILVCDDALNYLNEIKHETIHFIFIDAEKNDYIKYYKALSNLKMDRGTILFADNVISHSQELIEFMDYIKRDSSVYSTIIPIGKGLSFVRWI